LRSTLPSDYEYDHFVLLELGGATNDPRNLWSEPAASPNPKDAVEDYLNREVCERKLTLADAQSDRRQLGCHLPTAAEDVRKAARSAHAAAARRQSAQIQASPLARSPSPEIRRAAIGAQRRSGRLPLSSREARRDERLTRVALASGGDELGV
jgi:hypothetical protein